MTDMVWLSITPSDALDPEARKAVSELRRRAILDMPGAVYSPAQKRRWLELAEASDEERTEHDVTLRAFAARGGVVNALLGFAELDVELGELSALFVCPSSAGCGVGSLLFRAVEAEARRAHLLRLTLTASLDALGFYARMGFGRHRLGHAFVDGEAQFPVALLTKPVGRPTRRRARLATP